MQSFQLNEKNIWENMYFQVGIISKLASYFVPTTHFFKVTSRSVWPIVVRLLCRCLSISDFAVKYLCSSVRCLRGGAFPAQRHRYSQCPCRFFIQEIYNLLLCGHSVKVISGVLVCLITYKRLTNSVPKLSLTTLSPPETAG